MRQGEMECAGRRVRGEDALAKPVSEVDGK